MIGQTNRQTNIDYNFIHIDRRVFTLFESLAEIKNEIIIKIIKGTDCVILYDPECKESNAAGIHSGSL